MTKVLTIGAATQDIIIEYHEGLDVALVTQGTPHLAFKEGSKIEVEKLHYATGGGATNSAASFSQLGYEVTTAFKVGDDPAGTCIIESLQNEGIDVHAAVSKKEQTGVSFIIPSSKRDRVVFTYRGANTTLEQRDIPTTLFEQINCVYITSLTHKAADILPHLAYTAQKTISGSNLKVAVNPGTSQLTKNVAPLKATLSHIDILITNSHEMKLFMESLKPRFFKSTGAGTIADGPPLTRGILSYGKITFTLHEYLKEVFKYGVKRIVVTDGKQGVYVATKDQLFFHPSLPTEVVNSLGAGDAFGSCLVANLLRGKTIEDSIRAGILNASSVIMHHDAKSGLLTQSEINGYLTEFDNNLLTIYPHNI